MSLAYEVDAYGSVMLRLKVSDLSGTLVTAEDVSDVSYTIYDTSSFRRKVVPGHDSVSVGASCLASETESIVNPGKTYNLQILLSAQKAQPFPEPESFYSIVVALVDLDGEISAFEIKVRTR